MKLNYRLILITFLIVLVISISSTFIFYSLAGRVLTQQQSKSILASTNDFVFLFQSELQKSEEDFRSIVPFVNNFDKINLDSTSIDFCFTLVNDSLINTREFKLKTKSFLNIRSFSFRKFFSDNPNVSLRYAQFPNGKTVYYGNQISSDFLNHISEKVRAEVALVINDFAVEISNPEKNQVHLLPVINAVRELKLKNNFDIYTNELENADFVAALFTPKFLLTPGVKINFIVFEVFKEGVEFRATLRVVMLLIVLAGSALTFIIVWFFTAKLRSQISLLSQAAERTSKGNLEHRVTIITKDEIGKLGETFNSMLCELERNKKGEKEYTEFITLINQNPTLNEISEAALSKIIKSTGLTFGVLYMVEQKSLRLISSFGVSKKFIELTQDSNLYSNAIEKKEKVEFHFHDNFPEIKTGIASIKIKYLMIYPVLYNKETIAVLELASESIPQADVLNYISNIHEQLAVGLSNAKSFEQLGNFVKELKRLNDEYQKQNRQIIEQNDQLKELHKQLKEKAEELERQRTKAVELTKVKSEFLASMSHELRTPLISILGLTELLIKDSAAAVKTKDRLNIVHRNGKKLLGLINNILEFSKFESGKIEVKKESFLLSDLIEEIKPNAEQLASEKNLNFILDIQKNTDVLINTDKGKLEQVLLNLLMNAVKFTDKGSVKLSIKVIEGAVLEFAVSDTGIGISDEDKKIIFSEFKQVDGSASRKYGGAGLGLAICKKYVELLGGVLSVQSELGKGSRFYFELPDAALDVVEIPDYKFLTTAEEEKLWESSEIPNPDKSGLRESPSHILRRSPYGPSGEEVNQSVLIINANPDSQKLIGDYLSSYNYKIISTSSCSDGLRIAKEKTPDAIVLDPFIHDSNIWSVVSILKSDTSTRSIPIVLTMIIEENKVGWEPEIFDFITGTFTNCDLENLVSKVETHFENKIRKIVLLGENQSEYEPLKNSFENIYEMVLISSLNDAVEQIKNVNPQLVIIDMASYLENALQISFELSQNRLTKNIPIVLKLPEEFSAGEVKALNSKLREITLKVKAHPLDVLKVLRDRLKITDYETNKKINLIEETPVDSSKMVEEGNGIKPTVLIVDDDSDALFTIGEFVRELNCDTIFAHNGMECLLTLNHVEPDLIFLDIMMPQMDGFETIKRIRSEKHFANIPVVALTAYAMLDNKDIIEKNGFDDLVTKPISSQMLASKLKKFLKVKIG